jgi:hypothetical protein
VRAALAAAMVVPAALASNGEPQKRLTKAVGPLPSTFEQSLAAKVAGRAA